MRRTRVLAGLAALTMLAATACGSDSGGEGGEGGQEDTNLLVWTTEDQTDRVAAQKAILDRWAQSSGSTVELVAIAEDQLNTVLASSVAAGEGPDAIAALSLNGVNQLRTDDVLDTEVAGQIVEDLGAGTFVPRALELTRAGEDQLSVPSDGWAQLLFYRKDLLAEAGLSEPRTYADIEAAARALNSGDRDGVVAATAPSDSFTQQTFEQVALANGCQLTDAAGNVTLNSPQCQASLEFYANLVKNYSAEGNQDADTTRASYFAGTAGMVFWSSFLMDELAGLRNDALPTCPECEDDPSFLLENTGIVPALQGPQGTAPTVFGEVVSWTVLNEASPRTADMVKYMMTDGYTDWLGIAPEGKLPVRAGTPDNPQQYAQAWQTLQAGVDTKRPLSEIYDAQTLSGLTGSVAQFDRWGIPQGQGALAGQVGGQFVVPQQLAEMLNSDKSAADAAAAAQETAEGLKANLGE